MKQVSLAELAVELGINKSKLAYYNELGLIKPLLKAGGMNLFDHDNTVKRIKQIQTLKATGKKLKEIK